MKTCAGYLWICILAFSCTTVTSRHPSDLEASNIRGSVSKIKQSINSAHAAACCPAAESDDCKEVIYMYNDRGNLTEYSTVDMDGEIIQTSKYVYNRHNNCSEVNKFSGNKLVGKRLNVLRDYKLVRVKIFNKEGKQENTIRYNYSGNQVSGGITLNKEGEITGSFDNAYANGQLDSQTEKDGTGNITKITRFKRNSNNDVIETTITFPKTQSEQKFSYDYEYDGEGNWIKKTQRNDGEIVGIIMRNITYQNQQAGL